MKKINLGHLSAGLLILLYVYVAASKLAAMEEFKDQISLQALPQWMKPVLTWLLPALEITTAAALSFQVTKIPGFWLSTLLMACFTAYVILVLIHFFGKVPCACGGVISSLGWTGHLLFNLFFLLFSVIGLIYTYRERRNAWR